MNPPPDPLESRSDASLVARSRQGDRAAFEELVRRHQARVRRIARHLLDGTEEDADDVAQDAFLSAFSHLDQFRAERGSFATWLGAIVRHRVHNDRRRTRPRLDAGLEPRDGRTPERVSAGRESWATLDRTLASLPRAQRVAFVLAEFEGLGIEEIRRIEGVESGTVKSRIARARLKLRQALEAGREVERER